MTAVVTAPDHRPSLASFDYVAAHPLVQQLRKRVPVTAPFAVLVVAMVVWFLVFAVPVGWRHDRFGSFDHDLGIWDQYTWLLSRGRLSSLITVRGLTPFGFHASPGMALYVPFYWLGAGPNFLDVSMVGVVCVGAVPVFRAARHHLRNEWQALVLGLAFLVNYAAQWMLQETFHPEVIAIVPLLFAYVAAIEGRWRAYAVWIVLALIWKEDVALAVLMLGVVLAIRGRRTVTGRLGPERTRALGLATMAAAAIWFVFATRLLIPHFSTGGVFTESLFGDLGGTPTEMVKTAVTNPGIVGQHLEQSNPWDYLRSLLGSYGFVGLLSPLVLLVALPQALINLLAVYNFFWTTKVHYAAMPLLGVTLASVEGVARFRAPGVRRFLVGAVAVGAFFTCVSWGISPLSSDFRAGYWAIDPGPRQAELEHVVTIPGPDDPVSAAYYLVPHLTHRDAAYTFPNPWLPQNWGVADENRPDPGTVDWIIVDPSTLNPTEGGVLASALRDPERSLVAGQQPAPPADHDYTALVDEAKWDVVIDEPDLLVVHRRR